MRQPFTFLVLSLILLISFSCKNDMENSSNASINSTRIDSIAKKPVKRAPKKDLTSADIAIIQSVMSRIMSEPQLKKYASYLVSAEMVTWLSEENGPFTIFAPSTAALESLSGEQKKLYSSPENKAKLAAMLKSFIIPERMDMEALLQNIKKNGNARLKTVSGQVYTATKLGDEVIILNGRGQSAKIIKGSIEASNGVVYVVDGLIGIN